MRLTDRALRLLNKPKEPASACKGEPDGVTGRTAIGETRRPSRALKPVSLNGCRSADSIEARGHRPRRKAGYMPASDLNAITKPLQEGGCPYMTDVTQGLASITGTFNRLVLTGDTSDTLLAIDNINT